MYEKKTGIAFISRELGEKKHQFLEAVNIQCTEQTEWKLKSGLENASAWVCREKNETRFHGFQLINIFRRFAHYERNECDLCAQVVGKLYA